MVSADDILAKIDAAVGCHTCGAALSDECPSGDFCSADCQQAFHESLSLPLEGYREPWGRPWDFPGVGAEAAVSGDGVASWDIWTPSGLVESAMSGGTFTVIPGPPPPPMDPEVVGHILSAIWGEAGLEVTCRAEPEFQSMFDGLAEAARRSSYEVATMSDMWLDNPEPPTRSDVQQSALTARRNRNTGPQRRERAPRSIGRPGSMRR